MSKPNKKTDAEKRSRRVLRRTVRRIADELLTCNFGTCFAETGHRLAIMQGEHPNETNLGGRCRASIESLLMRHLSDNTSNQ